MNIVAYSGLAYLLTIVLYYLVIGIIVATDRAFRKREKKKEGK